MRPTKFLFKTQSRSWKQIAPFSLENRVKRKVKKVFRNVPESFVGTFDRIVLENITESVKGLPVWIILVQEYNKVYCIIGRDELYNFVYYGDLHNMDYAGVKLFDYRTQTCYFTSGIELYPTTVKLAGPLLLKE